MSLSTTLTTHLKHGIEWKGNFGARCRLVQQPVLPCVLDPSLQQDMSLQLIQILHIPSENEVKHRVMSMTVMGHAPSTTFMQHGVLLCMAVMGKGKNVYQQCAELQGGWPEERLDGKLLPFECDRLAVC